MKYNKLVRAKIPEIIVKDGKSPVCRFLKESEMQHFLEEKLNEEVAEYHESKSIEELADILEVVYALCRAGGNSIEELMQINLKKRNERGGFSKGIVLLEVTEE